MDMNKYYKQIVGCKIIEAENKTELYKILREKYPEDIGADAVGYDEDGEEFGIKW